MIRLCWLIESAEKINPVKKVTTPNTGITSVNNNGICILEEILGKKIKPYFVPQKIYPVSFPVPNIVLLSMIVNQSYFGFNTYCPSYPPKVMKPMFKMSPLSNTTIHPTKPNIVNHYHGKIAINNEKITTPICYPYKKKISDTFTPKSNVSDSSKKIAVRKIINLYKKKTFCDSTSMSYLHQQDKLLYSLLKNPN